MAPNCMSEIEGLENARQISNNEIDSCAYEADKSADTSSVTNVIRGMFKLQRATTNEKRS